MSEDDKPLAWLKGAVKTPPFSSEARIEAGFLLRRLQQGERLTLPHSRPMPRMGGNCHELRIQDEGLGWRIIHRVDADAILIVDVFAKKTRQTPRGVIEQCKRRLRSDDEAVKDEWRP